MRKNRLLSMTMAAAMTASTVLAGGMGTFTALASDEISHDEELTLEVYDVAANYQGLQSGWYGKILKDKFNIVLNIIAPQVSGDSASLYQTRCASGNLGDIVILDNADMQDCADVGLIADLKGEIENYPNLMKYQEQIDLFNSMIGDGSSTYAIPAEMNSNGPTAYMQTTVYSYPRIAWDLYTEAGAPDLQNLDDLLQVLSDIQTAHPTNDAGDPAYALSLWPDWDGTSIETVNQLTKWYGQEVNGSVLIGNDNSITPLTDKDGAYYKMLKFFFDANQMGLVDPDSATQDWNAACDKMRQKRVYLFWYSWQYGFWNSPDRGETRENYIAIPVADTNVFQTSDTYYGDGRVWGIGSQVSDENRARILEFLDWLASPEGCQYQHIGSEGLIYTVKEDGTYTMTDEGLVRYSTDIQVPEEDGGGLWQDGNNQVNQWIVAGVETNPLTGETYSSDQWASYIEKNMTTTTKEWIEKYGAENEVEYLENNGMLSPVASVNKALAIDTTDISLIRSQCGNLVCDTSWKMIYASSAEEFEQMWDDMCTQLEGFGWSQLVEFDTEKYQPVIEARQEAE
jgi:multiple sugar transport system substrate-binding protein/putative aldouronate transport system substrate-binding protein